MTPKQVELIKNCLLNQETAECSDDKLVEVGYINGVNPRTAESLVEAGLLVYDMPSWAGVKTSAYVRFPTVKELEKEMSQKVRRSLTLGPSQLKKLDENELLEYVGRHARYNIQSPPDSVYSILLGNRHIFAASTDELGRKFIQAVKPQK